MIHPIRDLFPPILALSLSIGTASAVQIEFGGPTGAEEKARVELYDSLRDEPRSTPVSRVVKAVTPSVVFVETEFYQYRRGIFGFERSTTQRGSGSGVVIHPSGLIVTNYHVVEGAGQIWVSFQGDPKVYDAELRSQDKEEDLALLKIDLPEGEGLSRTNSAGPRGNGLRSAAARPLQPSDGAPTFPSVRLGSSADLMPGERVVAIGSPHGQTYTVSTGIISGLHRDVPVPARQLTFKGLIQTDASINLGNSGGPLLNIHGELIGINTVMNASAENIGFAIPVDRVRHVLEDVLFPNARTVWFGFDVEQRGTDLVVTGVWPGGPADGSGICAGDELVALENAEISDKDAFLLESLKVDPGDTVTFQVERGGRVEHLDLVAWDNLNGNFFRDVGVAVSEVNLQHRGGLRRFLRVDSVRPDSPGEDLGLEEDDLLAAARPQMPGVSRALLLGEKGSLQTILDRVPEGTEIEMDVYRGSNETGGYELLKGVLIR